MLVKSKQIDKQKKKLYRETLSTGHPFILKISKKFVSLFASKDIYEFIITKGGHLNL